MSLFEKLKTAIRGNAVFKEYELGKHVCSAGPGLLWRVYEGFKKSTRQVSRPIQSNCCVVDSWYIYL